MFQSRLGKIDEFEWWDLEKISADSGTQFTLAYLKEEFQTCGKPAYREDRKAGFI